MNEFFTILSIAVGAAVCFLTGFFIGSDRYYRKCEKWMDNYRILLKSYQDDLAKQEMDRTIQEWYNEGGQ